MIKKEFTVVNECSFVNFRLRRLVNHIFVSNRHAVSPISGAVRKNTQIDGTTQGLRFVATQEKAYRVGLLRAKFLAGKVRAFSKAAEVSFVPYDFRGRFALIRNFDFVSNDGNLFGFFIPCQFAVNIRSLAVDKGIRAKLSGKSSPPSLYYRTSKMCSLPFHAKTLPFYRLQGSVCRTNAKNTNYDQNCTEHPTCAVYPIPRYRHGGKFGDSYGLLCVWAVWIIAALLIWGGIESFSRRRRFSGWCLIFGDLGPDFLVSATCAIGCLPWDWWRCLHDGQERSQN